MTLDDVDRAIADADKPGANRGKIISDIQYTPDLTSLSNKDPFSEDYASAVFDIFTGLRGETYSLNDESHIFDSPTTEPSPYNSHHPAIIGGHLGAIATVVRHIGVLPPGRILDLGFGTGDTSLLLARCGFEVDAVDVNARFVEILRHWTERLHVADRVRVIQTDYDTLSAVRGPYDAILFFESYHHSLHHASLLRRLKGELRPGGAIVFAGEPIYDHFPLPWGLRHQEGLATYCIRKMGWMELGFNTDYFLSLLENNGLCATQMTFVDYPVANHFRATLPLNSIPILNLRLSSRYAEGWHPADAHVRWTRGTARLPASFFEGARAAAVTLSNFRPSEQEVAIEIDGALAAGKTMQPGEKETLAFDLPAGFGDLTIRTEAWSPAKIGLNADKRTLGIAVQAIGLRRSA